MQTKLIKNKKNSENIFRKFLNFVICNFVSLLILVILAQIYLILKNKKEGMLGCLSGYFWVWCLLASAI